MPEDAQGKLQETLERIVNEGSGGLICIILIKRFSLARLLFIPMEQLVVLFHMSGIIY